MVNFCCAKYGVFIFTSLFALTGLLKMFVGGLVHHTFNNYTDFVGNVWYSVSVVMMVIGGIIYFVAFLGCCGAIRESPCMMRSFAICLLVIIIFEIVIVCTAVETRRELENILDRELNHTLTHYRDNELIWRLVQTEFSCCGINGPDDWKPVLQNTTVPRECCRNLEPPSSLCDRNDEGNVIEIGCKTKLFDFLNSQAVLFGVVGLVVALLQLIGLAYASYLYRVFNRKLNGVRSPKFVS